MKQEMTSADVAAIVAELSSGPKSLVDAKIMKIYQTTDTEIRINLFLHGRGRENLIIESGKRIHLSRYIKDSPKIPPAFPMLLRKHIMGGRILRTEQYGFDRIIKINIIRGGVETTLIVELFSKGNIILLDNEGKIILPLKPVTFKDRRIRSGEIYVLPETQSNPLTESKERMKEIIKASDRDAVRTLATSFNMGGTYSEEVFLRTGIDKTKQASELSDEEIEKIIETIDEIFEPIRTSSIKPILILKEDKKENQKGRNRKVEKETKDTENQGITIPDGFVIDDVIPVPLKLYENEKQLETEFFSDALDEVFGKTSLVEIASKKEEVKKDKKIGVFERRLNQQRETIKKFERQIEKNTNIAEAIYGNYQLVEELISTFNALREKYSWEEIDKTIKKAGKENTNEVAKIIKNINAAESSITVSLGNFDAIIDIKKTVPQNANVYYENIKKFQKKKSGAEKAILETENIIEKQSKIKEPEKKKAERKVRRRKKWYERFRWFKTSDDFLVIGGRDADSNEEIYKKYIEKRDLVFHTQAPGAPLTVIRTEGRDVSEEALLEAASFAVSYSSAWKSGVAEADCYMVKAEQVSKTPETGEYLPKGSFMIRGERTYFNNVELKASVGLELKEETQVIGGPESAIKSRANYVFDIVPGKFNQNDISKKIYRLYLNEIDDQKFLKAIASPDKIAMMLPPGESDIKGGPYLKEENM